MDLVKIFDKLGRHTVVIDKMTGEILIHKLWLLHKPPKDSPIDFVDTNEYGLYLHKFVKSDPADLHDHPWDFWHMILKGGYYEHTLDGNFWRGIGYHAKRKAEYVHRVELEEDFWTEYNGQLVHVVNTYNEIPSWSLFFRWPKRRTWGLIKDNIWIAHREYFERYYAKNSK